MNQPQPIPGIIGYYASEEGIHSSAKNGDLLKADGRRSTNAAVKTKYGRLNVYTLILIAAGHSAASTWAREYDRRSRAAWLRFRRDNPESGANHWGPLTADELDWLSEYDAANPEVHS